MAESVLKPQGLAQQLEQLPEDQAMALVLTLALGTDEEKAKLAEAFKQQEKDDA